MRTLWQLTAKSEALLGDTGNPMRILNTANAEFSAVTLPGPKLKVRHRPGCNNWITASALDHCPITGRIRARWRTAGLAAGLAVRESGEDDKASGGSPYLTCASVDSILCGALLNARLPGPYMTVSSRSKEAELHIKVKEPRKSPMLQCS